MKNYVIGAFALLGLCTSAYAVIDPSKIKAKYPKGYDACMKRESENIDKSTANGRFCAYYVLCLHENKNNDQRQSICRQRAREKMRHS